MYYSNSYIKRESSDFRKVGKELSFDLKRAECAASIHGSRGSSPFLSEKRPRNSFLKEIYLLPLLIPVQLSSLKKVSKTVASETSKKDCQESKKAIQYIIEKY